MRSMVGLLPLRAATTLGSATLDGLPEFAARFAVVHSSTSPKYARSIGRRHERAGATAACSSVVDGGAAARVLATMLDEDGVPLAARPARALAPPPRAPVRARRSAAPTYAVGYEPGESTTGLFGGNSNWRGPVWFPVN